MEDMSDNTTPRAHVDSPALAEAWQSDDLPIAKISRSPDEKLKTSNPNDTAAITQLLSRKEKRKKQKHREKHIPASTSQLEFSEPTSDDEREDEPVQSRKQKKKLLQQQNKVAEKIAKSLLAASKLYPPKKSSTPYRSESDREHPAAPSAPPPSSMGYAQLYPLLVCSLGNPGKQYANTLHSAGHQLLNYVREAGCYTPFARGWGGTMCTPSMARSQYHVIKGFTKKEVTELQPDEDNWTLWQSTKLMNVSGPGVKSAWQAYSAQQKALGKQPRLVIVHDELEAPLGTINIKPSTASAKGHNGVKSCQASLQNLKYWRVTVGIGRPESRDQAVVSNYVLRKMTSKEEAAIQDSRKNALLALRMIAEGKVS